MKASCSSGQLTASGVPFTLLALYATSARKPKLLQVIIGCSDATPTATSALFAIRFITAAGTGTAGVTFALNKSNGAPSVTAVINHTGEPTYQTGDPIEIPLNMSSTAIWQPPLEDAAPESNLSTGTVIGIGIQMITGPTAKDYNVSVTWEE
ncbi:MAG TPA: hypothetical protein VK816_04855 [Jatrophihabitantaceae bacterium]|jgi:hypothetical protein|nr:hypothetical protein [Jatrophihabitantaceae bacterium]